MPLVLQPTFNETTREEYEAFLEQVRARRLTAAIEYMEGQKLKLDREADLAQRKLGKELDMLNKDLERMEKLDNVIQMRMVKIETYRQEVGFITEMVDKGLMEDTDDE